MESGIWGYLGLVAQCGPTSLCLKTFEVRMPEEFGHNLLG